MMLGVERASLQSRMRRGRRHGRSLLWTGTGIAVVAVLLFPLYLMVVASLMSDIDLLRYPPLLLPEQPTLAGYQAAISEASDTIVSSFVISIGTVLVTMIVATPAAYALARFRFRLGRLMVFALLLAQMIPGIAMAIAVYTLFGWIGWLNSYPAVILADSTIAIPFAIIVMRAFMLTIPEELREAAFMDGASQWRVFWSIAVPLSRNAIITAALFAFLFAWGDFLFAVTLNNDPHKSPITVGIYHWISSYQTQWYTIMSLAVVASIPTALLLILAQRHVAAGMTTGALRE